MTKILLIDDEPGVRESVTMVLEREGYTVVAAENATIGLQQLSEQAFDVLISDIIMPGIDGVKAITQARKANPGLKIIAISGGGNIGLEGYKPEAITTTAYLQAAAEAGADCVLTKPFERAELLGNVKALVDAS